MAGSQPADVHTHRVLVVEDDHWMREAMLETLAAAGCQPLGARDGAEALAHLEAEGLPCVIFLDLAMPGMDGRQFMDEVRRRPALAKALVVLATAHGTVKDAQSLGAVDLLKKPFTFDRLPELVSQHCAMGS